MSPTLFGVLLLLLLVASIQETMGESVSDTDMENISIVTLKRDVINQTDFDIDDFQEKLKKKAKKAGKMSQVEIGSFRGIAVSDLSSEDVAQIDSLPEVAFVEQNTEVSLSTPTCQTQNVNADNWGCARIGREDVLPGEEEWPDEGLPYEYQGSDGTAEEDKVYAYVIDSGVDRRHAELGGRVAPEDESYIHDWAYNSDQDKKSLKDPATDNNGHGTHVAGIIIGETNGVARNAIVVPVKAFNFEGRGFIISIIDALKWAVNDIVDKGRKAVINASFGTAIRVHALDAAMEGALEKRIPVVIAAGNGGGDACLKSPAGIGGDKSDAITVGATNRLDELASFSDYGKCVDILAPGRSINSSWIPRKSCKENCYVLASGTSMSAPFVTGIIAQKLASAKTGNPAKEMKKYVTRAALIDKIAFPNNEIATTTKNLLAHSKCPP